MRIKDVLLEGYIAFEIDKKSRKLLMDNFPPKYPDVIAHHITYIFGVKSDTKMPRTPKRIEVIGYADDEESIEALVVSINGSHVRPDGKTYHITWSLDRSKGRKPVHSNNLLEHGWKKIDNPIEITARVSFFK